MKYEVRTCRQKAQMTFFFNKFFHKGKKRHGEVTEVG